MAPGLRIVWYRGFPLSGTRQGIGVGPLLRLEQWRGPVYRAGVEVEQLTAGLGSGSIAPCGVCAGRCRANRCVDLALTRHVPVTAQYEFAFVC